MLGRTIDQDRGPGLRTCGPGLCNRGPGLRTGLTLCRKAPRGAASSRSLRAPSLKSAKMSDCAFVGDEDASNVKTRSTPGKFLAAQIHDGDKDGPGPASAGPGDLQNIGLKTGGGFIL